MMELADRLTHCRFSLAYGMAIGYSWGFSLGLQTRRCLGVALCGLDGGGSTHLNTKRLGTHPFSFSVC